MFSKQVRRHLQGKGELQPSLALCVDLHFGRVWKSREANLNRSIHYQKATESENSRERWRRVDVDVSTGAEFEDRPAGRGRSLLGTEYEK